MIKKLKFLLVAYISCVLVAAPIAAWGQLAPSASKVESLKTEQKKVRSFGTEPEEENKEHPSMEGRNQLYPDSDKLFFYSVHVTGEVKQPGSYKVIPSDRVSDALRNAGGISMDGSQRRVELRRNGQVQFLDIYAYKFRGDLSQNPYLLDNDMIFIPVRMPEFRIEGPVNRPGYYEIIGKTNLKQAIGLASGLAAGLAQNEPIRVIRFDPNGRKDILEVLNRPDALSQFYVQGGDIIVCPHFLLSKKKFDYNVDRIPGDNIFYPTINDNVYVVGAVSNPGPYAFLPTYHVKDYVSQAGPNNGSSLGRVKVITAEGKKKQVSKMYSVNPGETIIVPAKAITANNFIMWFGALTSMALTTFIFVDRFAK